MGRNKSAVQLSLICLRIPTNLKFIIRERVIGKNPSYVNESDFYRAAIREKIQRDYHDLLGEIEHGGGE